MNLKLNQHKKRGPTKKKPRSQTEKHQLGCQSSPCQAEEQLRGPPGQPIKWFHCGQQGHRGADCLAPAPMLKGKPPEPTKPTKPPQKAPSGVEGTPAQGPQLLMAYDSDKESEDDLMSIQRHKLSSKKEK
ncbi:hypothetical protein E2320_022550 [Naja naja]|nr:hypothetical protein E2320_022550 [Naja naja]